MRKDLEGYFNFVLFNQLETLEAIYEIYKNVPDRGSHDELYNDELNTFMMGRAAEKRREILETLERLEKGSFGVCNVCGEKIDLNMLQKKPTACFCVSCFDQQERTGKKGLGELLEMF
ncbi:MAG: TraR/DksA C4-type zinc finger protein [Syntrophales bacterium]|nr:TraR/DksA C4-type zinc finger protein [Syntrophales bacterium]